MPKVESPHITQGAIWIRLLEPGSQQLFVETARFLLALDFPTQDKDRMRELTAKTRAGALTTTEQEELTTSG
ncbi:MAG: hypothetical protein ACK4RK_16860 [Gemmataceae bacterium]